MTPDQRHGSEPFVCLNNLLISESPVCFRRGSTSLVEMLRCGTQPPTKTSPFLCPSMDLVSPKSAESSVHATDHLFSNSAQNASVLSPLLSAHHDSARRFNSPLLPLKLQPPSERGWSAPRSPQPDRHCKACMSLLLRDKTKGGGSLGHTHIRSFATSTQFTAVSNPGSHTSHLSKSPPVTLPLHYASPSLPPPSSLSPPLTSPSYLPPPSQVARSRSLYEGADLTLLNHCLHHIVGRRTSTPTLPDRVLTHPMGPTSSVFERVDKSQSLEIPLPHCCPYLDRNKLSLPHSNTGRADPLVG